MQVSLPIKFPVVVEGKRQIANLVKVNDHVIHSSYLIQFSDGYQDSFHDYVDNNVRGLNERDSHPYAIALKHDLPLFKWLRTCTSMKFFAWKQEVDSVNGWMVTTMHNNTELYTVYIQGKYHFDIWEKDGNWIVNADMSKGPQPIDNALAQYAVNLIGKKPALPLPDKNAKEIEFELDFFHSGKTIKAFGLLLPVKPFAQVNIGIQTGTPAQPHMDMFQFFKIDSKEKIFSWHPCPPDKEPIAIAIANALEKKFSTANFCRN